MKNRTIIGIVCMILAVAMTFAIAPVVNRLTSDTTTVVRLKQEVGRGTKITEDKVYKEQKPFRVLKFGKVIRVPKVSFDNWLNGKGDEV